MTSGLQQPEQAAGEARQAVAAGEQKEAQQRRRHLEQRKQYARFHRQSDAMVPPDMASTHGHGFRLPNGAARSGGFIPQ